MRPRPISSCSRGDYVIQGVLGGRHVPIETIAEKLSALSPPLGIFAVLGNHDHWENSERIANVLEGAGIAVLENKAKKSATCRTAHRSIALWSALRFGFD